MDKSALKTEILSAISAELDLWLEKAENINDGYQYETEFMRTAQCVNKILLSKSLGQPPSNRNKKNPHLFWKTSSKQISRVMQAHREIWN
jgi:hypothetical protein